MTGTTTSTAPGTRSGEDGFSLIEMLAAVVILALVLAFLPGTFRLTQATWRATAQVDRAAARDSSREFLQARLQEAMPLFERAPSGLVSLAFHGASDAVSFIAPSANGPAGGGLYKFTLSVRSRGEGQSDLVLALAPYAPPGAGSGQAPPPEEHILYESIGGASLRYYGRNPARAAPAWHAEWPRQDALPMLVELSMAGGTGPGRTLVVELRLRSAQ